MTSRAKALFAAALAVLLVVVAVAIVRKPDPGLPDLPQSQAITLKTKSNAPGAVLAPDAQGISLETAALTEPGFGRGNLGPLLRNLGGGTIRIGGNSTESVFWTSTNEPQPQWAESSLKPEHIEQLAKVARDSGWTVTFTVNLKQYDPARAAEETATVARILGPSLTAIEIGNEPDSYYTDVNKYLADYDTYIETIRARTPGTVFVGNDSAKSIGPFQNAYLDYVNRTKKVSSLAQHGYPLSACEQRPDIDRLLTLKTYEAEKGLFSVIADNARKAGVPGRINETNSVACEGFEGVSDTHASAVWAVSHTLAAEAAGLTNVNYHGSIARCGDVTPKFKHYTPFCAKSEDDAKAGKLTPRPLYYGMLAAASTGSGRFIGVDNPAFATVHAYAVQDGNTLRVAISNIQDPLKFGTTAVTLQLDQPYRQASSLALATDSNKGLAATNDTTFGGAKVKGSSLGEKKPVAIPLSGNTVNLQVPAGSSTILTLTR